MSLLIRGATLVSPAGTRDVDILCRAGRIAAVGLPGRVSSPQRADVIEANGLLAFAGFIDPHVHSRDPGQTHKEDFAHVTTAAAIGGVTTILDQPNSLPPVRDAATVRDRIDHHTSVAFVDFGLWGIALGRDNLSDLAGLQQTGVVACKLFWGFAFDQRTGALVYGAPTGASISPPVSSGELWQLFREAAATNLLIGLHCEDREILEVAAESGPIVDYETLNAARPIVAETGAIALAIEIAASTRARIHILHVSSGRGIELVRSARESGLAVSAETCPHYLTLTSADYASIGPVMKVYPPIRDSSDQEALWRGVNDGTVASVGSDHAPHSLTERSGPLADQPAGMVGVETMVPLLVDAALRGRTTLERLSWVLGEGTARMYGLFPRKGCLLPGADADITLVDPKAQWKVDNDLLHSKTRLSPWHGRSGNGVPVMTILGGVVVAERGRILRGPLGKFVPRIDSPRPDGHV